MNDFCSAMETLKPSLNRLMPRLDGISKPLLAQELREALKQFCIDSKVWRFEFEEIQTQVGEATYHIPEQDNAAIIEVADVWLVEGEHEQRIYERGGVRRDGLSRWLHWFSPEPDTVVFNHPFEECNKRLRLVVALRPSEQTERLPRSLYERWKKAIEHKTLAECYAMPNKRWTDYNLANFNESEYHKMVSQAKATWQMNLGADRPAFINPYTFR